MCTEEPGRKNPAGKGRKFSARKIPSSGRKTVSSTRKMPSSGWKMGSSGARSGGPGGSPARVGFEWGPEFGLPVRRFG